MGSAATRGQVERSDLRFGRWVRQAPYLPQCGSLAETPHFARLTQLPEMEQYAAVELFRGTILRHSLVVFRDDFPGDSQPIRFRTPATSVSRLERAWHIGQEAGLRFVYVGNVPGHRWENTYCPDC